MGQNHVIYARVSPALYERTKKAAAYFHRTITQIAQDAVDEKVTKLEEKMRSEQEVARRAPSKRTRQNDAPTSQEAAPPVDLLAALYARHARRILEVIDIPSERQIRVDDAIAAVKHLRPLTHPSEQEILLKLEAAIREITLVEQELLTSHTPSAVEEEPPATPTTSFTERRMKFLSYLNPPSGGKPK